MLHPPLPGSFNGLRTAEVRDVLRLAQPPSLAGGFAGSLTVRLRAVFLPVAGTVVRLKQLLAVQALAFRFSTHEHGLSKGADAPKTGREEKGFPGQEEKSRKEGKKIFCEKVGEEDRTEEDGI